MYDVPMMYDGPIEPRPQWLIDRMRRAVQILENDPVLRSAKTPGDMMWMLFRNPWSEAKPVADQLADARSAYAYMCDQYMRLFDEVERNGFVLDYNGKLKRKGIDNG